VNLGVILPDIEVQNFDMRYIAKYISQGSYREYVLERFNELNEFGVSGLSLAAKLSRAI
jgi:hypothetical protein